jgi:hypothetical protein
MKKPPVSGGPIITKERRMFSEKSVVSLARTKLKLIILKNKF